MICDICRLVVASERPGKGVTYTPMWEAFHRREDGKEGILLVKGRILNLTQRSA
jgi:hypothetical protein